MMILALVGMVVCITIIFILFFGILLFICGLSNNDYGDEKLDNKWDNIGD